jgi:hypothetical protein
VKGRGIGFLTHPAPSSRCSSLPPGYVEGLNDARTKLGASFNILATAP